MRLRIEHSAVDKTASIATLIQAVVRAPVAQTSTRNAGRPAAIIKCESKVLAPGLMLCVFFHSRSQFSRGTNSSLRTRLIGEMGTGSFEPGGRSLSRERIVRATRSIVKRSRGKSAGSWISYIVTGHAQRDETTIDKQGIASGGAVTLQGALMIRAARRLAFGAVNMASSQWAMRAQSDISISHFPSGSRIPASTASCRRDAPPGS